MSRVGSPINTRLLDAIGQDSLLQERLLLNGIDVQTSANMPRNMAVERPHTRVVSVVLQHDIARRSSGTTLHNLHVATLGIRLVDDFAVPGPDALRKDVEVMAVQMHGVGGRELILDNNSDGAVVAEIVDIPLGVVGVGEVALVRQDKDWVALESEHQQRKWTMKSRDETHS